MHKGVGGGESQGSLQMGFRQIVLTFTEIVKSQVLLRAWKSWVQAGGSLVIFVSVLNTAQLGLSDSDEVLERSILWPDAARILKLLQRGLVFFLAKKLKSALQGIALSQSDEREQKRRHDDGTKIHGCNDSIVVICFSS